jgi:DNA-binding NtrC family response regulator
MPGRILIVDDEKDMLALLRRMITEDRDYSVATECDPVKALERFREDPVECVITDLKMPGMDGIELLAEVKRRDEATVVMVITAYGSLESAQEAIARGAFDFITKPFRKEQILLAVDKALRWRDMLRQNKELKRQLATQAASEKTRG